MPIYKARLPDDQLGYSARMPTALTHDYKVQSSGAEQMSIDTLNQPVAPGIEWTIDPDPGSGASAGDTPRIIQAPFGSYTITWLDTAFGFSPPGPEGPLSLTPGNPIDFDLY
jgi:hypothetical protein